MRNKEKTVLTSARDRMKEDLPPVVTEKELLEGVNLLRKTWGDLRPFGSLNRKY